MNWYLNVLKNYAVIDGRARRTEYWMFALINFIVIFILSIIDAMIFREGVQVLMWVYQLAVLVPAIAVAIRRLHDIDKSGYWYLLIFIPILGWLVLLFFACTPGTSGQNTYGPDPIGQPNP